MAFSPDGKLLATGSESQTIQIWDATTRQRVLQLRGHQGKVTSLAFAPDGRTLASATTDGDVRLWNPTRPTGELRMANDLDRYGMNPPSFSGDGHRLGLLMNSHQSFVLDVPNLQVSGIVAGEIASISPDGTQLATVDSDSELQLWKTGAASNRARIHLETTGARLETVLQFSPADNAIALDVIQGESLRAELYDAATGEKIFSPDWTSEIPAGCFSPDGRIWIYSVGSEIKFFDLQAHTNTQTLKCNAVVNYLTVSTDGKTLAASQADDAISLWGLERGVQLGTLTGHQAKVFSLAFSTDGRTLASGSEDRTVKLWHLATRRELASFTQEKGVYWLAFSPDDQILVAGGVGFYQFLRAPRHGAMARFGATIVSMADLPTNSIWRVPDGADRTPSRMANEQAQCFTNMLKISAAIMAYRKDHQQMPDWLSDLVPKYLSDTNCLICPTCARTGEKPDNYGMDDPNIKSSYLYEFNTHPALIDPLGLASPGDTMKVWKEKQLARYGPVVPVVRCHVHPNVLSVTFAGEPRVDGKVLWEISAEIALQLKQGTGTNVEWLNNTAYELVTAEDTSNRNPALAVKLAERAVELAPTVANYWNTLGIVLYRNGEFKQAIVALEKSVQLGNVGPVNYDPTMDFIFLAMGSHQLDNNEAARRYYSQAVQCIKLQKQLDWEFLPFQIEARNLLGPALLGQTEFENLMPANVK